MNVYFLLLAFIAALVNFVAATAQPQTAPVGSPKGTLLTSGMYYSCKDFKAIGDAYCGRNGNTWLTASCLARDQSRTTSVLNLNHCIVNNFGKISAEAEGNFGKTCNFAVPRTPAMKGTELRTHCSKPGSNWPEYTTLNLDPFIGNDDGQLRCFDARGCSIDDRIAPISLSRSAEKVMIGLVYDKRLFRMRGKCTPLIGRDLTPITRGTN
ncbi:hypothetical protein GGR57DRAFT_105382 [Xylariaceae sp. FL1272]|nr:hypothetical protein GGR57DRAFT_105382 [Xylariaceae sp. FL1272]